MQQNECWRQQKKVFQVFVVCLCWRLIDVGLLSASYCYVFCCKFWFCVRWFWSAAPPARHAKPSARLAASLSVRPARERRRPRRSPAVAAARRRSSIDFWFTSHFSPLQQWDYRFIQNEFQTLLPVVLKNLICHCHFYVVAVLVGWSCINCQHAFRKWWSEVLVVFWFRSMQYSEIASWIVFHDSIEQRLSHQISSSSFHIR